MKIAEALPEAATLVKELLNFKVKIDAATAHDNYSSWRENIHDDLVLAVALACWIAEAKGDATPAYTSVVPREARGSLIVAVETPTYCGAGSCQDMRKD